MLETLDVIQIHNLILDCGLCITLGTHGFSESKEKERKQIRGKQHEICTIDGDVKGRTREHIINMSVPGKFNLFGRRF